MAGEVVIADAGPLIGLAVIDHLALLPAMFSRVVVPPAVWHETTSDTTAPGAKAIRDAGFIIIEQPALAHLRVAQESLEGGEAEAIALAMGLPSAVVLVDDLEARKVAQQLHLQYTGTIGLLVVARRADRVAALRPLLDGLVAHGLYLSPKIIAKALADVGES